LLAIMVFIFWQIPTDTWKQYRLHMSKIPCHHNNNELNSVSCGIWSDWKSTPFDVYMPIKLYFLMTWWWFLVWCANC
jgi:hypothetical protein